MGQVSAALYALVHRAPFTDRDARVCQQYILHYRERSLSVYCVCPEKVTQRVLCLSREGRSACTVSVLRRSLSVYCVCPEKAQSLDALRFETGQHRLLSSSSSVRVGTFHYAGTAWTLCCTFSCFLCFCLFLCFFVRGRGDGGGGLQESYRVKWCEEVQKKM